MLGFTHASIVLCIPLTVALDCACPAIQKHLPDNARVTDAHYVVNGGTFEVSPGDIAYPTSPTNLRELCAVQVNVTSSPNSAYSFGIFLPYDWNKRFLAVGNSGFSGGINWIDMGAGVGYGFASMSTDTGHNSTLLGLDWAFQNEESRVDWGYRALHGSVVIAKDLARAFYNEDVEWSYFSGCSTGGRQGLKEAQVYPNEFDGILAGAPAWWTTHLSTWTIKLGLDNLPTTAPYHIPASLFPSIAAEVIRQCDALDGVKDNILMNPETCHFIPELMLCSSNVTNQSMAGCLTAPQVETLYKIYSAYTDANQTFIFPGVGLGSEAQWMGKLGGSAPSSLGTEYPRYFLDFGSDWDFYEYNSSLAQLADARDPGDSNADNYNLERFQKRGGKLLTYHGLSDGMIPPQSSEYFYLSVLRSMGLSSTELNAFYRHFFVPGLQHCVGTPENVDAPWYIAGGNQAAVLDASVYSVPGFGDADHDALLALIAWTENGTAPERIVATKWRNDTAHKEVLRQRPICVFPKVAKYDGRNDPNQAASWSCQQPWIQSSSIP